MSSYTKVLVGTDGSESSFRAVERATKIAIDSGAVLIIASAFKPLSERDRESAVDQLGSDAWAILGSDPATSVLREAEQIARKAGATEVETASEGGDPVEVLVQLVAEHQVDLCVVGNRGLNSIVGRLLGSVPSNISHRAGCDVLIVHTTDGGR